MSDFNYYDEEDDPEWNGEYVGDQYDSFIDKIEKAGFTYRNEGSFRKVFERRGVVIKVPMVSDGIIDNMVEHRAYHTYWNGPTRRGILIAPCRLLPNKCLMMRKMQWVDGAVYDYPAWRKTIDGSQVGPYNGRIVAYDYAINLTERFKWEEEWGVRSKYFHSRENRRQNAVIRNYLNQRERRMRLATG